MKAKHFCCCIIIIHTYLMYVGNTFLKWRANQRIWKPLLMLMGPKNYYNKKERDQSLSQLLFFARRQKKFWFKCLLELQSHRKRYIALHLNFNIWPIFVTLPSGRTAAGPGCKSWQSRNCKKCFLRNSRAIFLFSFVTSFLHEPLLFSFPSLKYHE